MFTIEEISEATEKRVEEMMKSLCKKIGIDCRLFIFVSTGGLHYVMEKIIVEIFLSDDEIDNEARKLLKIFGLGFNMEIPIYGSIFSFNKYLKTLDKDSYEYNKRFPELEKIRKKFVKEANKIEKKFS